MRIGLVAVLVLVLVGDLAAATRVRGYTRRDGTYVAPHYRSSPDGVTSNNWSTKGNVNPYTGKRGTKRAHDSGAGYVEPVVGAPVVAAEAATDDVDDRSGWYAGVGLGSFTDELTGGGLDLSLSAFGGYGQLGYAINENIAFEARVGATGTATENGIVDPAFFGVPVPVSLDIETDHFVSLFARFSTSDIGSGFRLFGLLGGTSAKSTGTFKAFGVPLVTVSDTDTSLSYGAGVEKDLSDQFSIGVEYIRYYEEESLGLESTTDAVSVNGRWRF